MRWTQVVSLVATLVLPVAALAQEREWAAGAGYGHLFLDGSDANELEEQGGLVLNGRVSWPVGAPMTDRRPELRFGLGGHVAFYRSETDDDFDDDDDFFDDEVDVTQLTMLVPELQLSVRQPIGDFYLEPGIAGQFILGNYWRGEESWWDVDEDEDIWRVGGGARLFLRGAYQWDRWFIGVEGSYSYGWLDFGHDIGGDIQQGFIGVFFGRTF